MWKSSFSAGQVHPDWRESAAFSPICLRTGVSAAVAATWRPSAAASFYTSWHRPCGASRGYFAQKRLHRFGNGPLPGPADGPSAAGCGISPRNWPISRLSAGGCPRLHRKQGGGLQVRRLLEGLRQRGKGAFAVRKIQKCTEIYCALWQSGSKLEQLAVAV